MSETAPTLPHAPADYAASPSATWRKASEWLNARWQLRKCDQVGAWTRVTGRLFIQNWGRISIGSRVQLHAHYAPLVLATFRGGAIEIGDRSVVNYGTDIAAARLVRIGADCLIGTHVTILDTDFHGVVDRDKPAEPNPVLIGDRAWIGNRVIVLPGVTIGDSAVVGAGSVVMADVPPLTLAMGNPARVIKQF